ncbi:MAG: energy transducer TonB [Pseudomonadota bacterium]
MTAPVGLGAGQGGRRSVDWLASRSGPAVLGDVAGWAMASGVVVAVFAASVGLALWLDRMAGAAGVQPTAVLMDLPPLPPAIATTEAAPDAPDTDLPESLDPVAEEETAPPDLPDPEPDVVPDVAPPLALPMDMAEVPIELDKAVVPLPVKADPPVAPKPAPKAAPVKKPEPARKTAAKPSQQQAAQTQAASKGQIRSATAKWGAAIRKKIERRKAYPKSAGRATGTATVRLSVARNGALAGVSLVGSSGNPVLDDAAVAAVRKAGSFAAAPAELTRAQYSFTLPISFSR